MSTSPTIVDPKTLQPWVGNPWWPHDQLARTYTDLQAIATPERQAEIARQVLSPEAQAIDRWLNPVSAGPKSSSNGNGHHNGDGNDGGGTPGGDLPSDPAIQDRRICEMLKIDVLGENEQGHVFVFAYHPARRKISVIRQPHKISYAEMLQVCGQPAKDHIATDPEDTSKKSMTAVRNAICLLAGDNRITNQSMYGVGCWQALNSRGHEIPGVILVNKGEAAIWHHEEKRLERHFTPRVGGRLVQLSEPYHWYDFDQLEAYLKRCDEEPDWPGEVIEETRKIFDRWLYEHQRATPHVLTGMVLATWVQTLWHWRPQMAIIGETDSGKTCLFEFLGEIFGRITEKSSKSSAAGIRQAIETRAKAVLCDEFEKSRHRTEILEMIRASSRGDSVLRGTPGGQTQRFLVRHVVWVAGIESGMKRAPDRNRFITIGLKKPPPEDHGKLTLPDQEDLHDLGQKLLAIAVRFVLDAKPIAARLKKHHIEGVEQRIIESYAAPVSILAAAGRLTEEQTAKLLEACVGDSGVFDDPIMSDQDELLEFIMRYVATFDLHGRRHNETIANMIGKDGTDYTDGLEKFGIRVAEKKEGVFRPRVLFIDYKDVATKILLGTQWEDQSIDQILMRLPGATRDRQRVGGIPRHGISIPMKFINEQVFDTKPEIFDSFSDTA